MTMRVPGAPGAAPLNRRYLDYFGTPARIIAGCLFIGYSGWGTVRFVQRDFDRVLGDQTWLSFPAPLMLGIILAVCIFVGELITAEHYKQVYGVILAVDAFYTFRLTFPWLAIMMGAASGPIWYGLTAIIAVVGSAAVAWAGEVLLFGKRRR